MQEQFHLARRTVGMTKLKICTFAALIVAGLTATAWSQTSPMQERTRQFLDAYANGDRKAVLGLVDQTNVTMYGSDLAEVVHGSDAVLKLLDADQRLWGGPARIGPIEHVSMIESKRFASIIFDISFSVGGRPPVPVRVVAVWKRQGNQWLLVQSSNSVVTEHQSTDELLGHP